MKGRELAIQAAELLYRARRLLDMTTKADRHYDARALAEQAAIVSQAILQDLGLDPGTTQQDADNLKLRILHEPAGAWLDEEKR